MKNKTPPGMIIYATLFPMFERMSLEQVGRLVMGMCKYFTTGMEPELPAELAISWPLVQDQIDRNVAAYFKKTAENDLKGAYSQYVRKAKENGATPLPYARWKDTSAGGAEDERDASDTLHSANDTLGDASVGQQTKTKQNQNNNITEIITKPNLTEAKTETKTNPADVAAGMPPSLEEVRAYCAENQLPVSAEAFYYHYETVGWKVGKTPIRDWKAAVHKWALNQQSQASSSPACAENNDNRPTREELERLKCLRDKIRGEGAGEKSPSS
ncbi:MAG: DUF6291 domain-containing protein [Oscillospiraceae bacterium]|nr:DUF6291 domain-containing protein [Oscillospiraceae bacterium]